MKPLVVGTRGSALALAQAHLVIAELSARGIDAVERVITTDGDRTATTPRGDGAFVKAIQRALTDGDVDLAVHSLKDVPTEGVQGLVLAAVPVRADAREVLVGATLSELPRNARVGTGSPRRAAQLRALRADLQPVSIRGNVPTRIAKARGGEVDAVVLARAGLVRLGLASEAAEVFSTDAFPPAPGQGALAIEARDGEAAAALASPLDHPPSRISAHAEREVLRMLGGGCMLPVAAYGSVSDGVLTLDARVVSIDGTREARARESGPVGNAQTIASTVARGLENLGALELLDA